MTICGTDEYMAPEMLFDESFSYPADIFSFGKHQVVSYVALEQQMASQLGWFFVVKSYPWIIPSHPFSKHSFCFSGQGRKDF